MVNGLTVSISELYQTSKNLKHLEPLRNMHSFHTQHLGSDPIHPNFFRNLTMKPEKKSLEKESSSWKNPSFSGSSR